MTKEISSHDEDEDQKKKKNVSIDEGYNEVFEIERICPLEKAKHWWSKTEIKKIRNDYKNEVMMDGVRNLVKARIEQEEDDNEIIEERLDEIMADDPSSIARFLQSEPKPMESRSKKITKSKDKPSQSESDTDSDSGSDSDSDSDSDDSSSSSSSSEDDDWDILNRLRQKGEKEVQLNSEHQVCELLGVCLCSEEKEVQTLSTVKEQSSSSEGKGRKTDTTPKDKTTSTTAVIESGSNPSISTGTATASSDIYSGNNDDDSISSSSSDDNHSSSSSSSFTPLALNLITLKTDTTPKDKTTSTTAVIGSGSNPSISTGTATATSDIYSGNNDDDSISSSSSDDDHSSSSSSSSSCSSSSSSDDELIFSINKEFVHCKASEVPRNLDVHPSNDTNPTEHKEDRPRRRSSSIESESESESEPIIENREASSNILMSEKTRQNDLSSATMIPENNHYTSTTSDDDSVTLENNANDDEHKTDEAGPNIQMSEKTRHKNDKSTATMIPENNHYKSIDNGDPVTLENNTNDDKNKTDNIRPVKRRSKIGKQETDIARFNNNRKLLGDRFRQGVLAVVAIKRLEKMVERAPLSLPPTDILSMSSRLIEMYLPSDEEKEDHDKSSDDDDSSDDDSCCNDNSECPVCLGLVKSSQHRKIILLRRMLCKRCFDTHYIHRGVKHGKSHGTSAIPNKSSRCSSSIFKATKHNSAKEKSTESKSRNSIGASRTDDALPSTFRSITENEINVSGRLDKKRIEEKLLARRRATQRFNTKDTKDKNYVA